MLVLSYWIYIYQIRLKKASEPDRSIACYQNLSNLFFFWSKYFNFLPGRLDKQNIAKKN